ncbi:tRNA-specific 2-thiouridylase [Trema orientale]|uniref:tRNA-5-taurinomethyluridine 2-sulfurtransferase n=1 Tax=Trema orientale TaxID=63057 RepID=A0A2P5DD47_TREOI|nr:tRNA-specific 2-thiouridylase [Trema orientale]
MPRLRLMRVMAMPYSSSPLTQPHLVSLPLKPRTLLLRKPHKPHYRPSSSSTIIFFARPFSASATLSSSAEPQIPYSLKSFDGDLQPYLRCSMPHKRLKVAVLLSGGVDSSVALRLLHAAGHSCTAFYLKIWFQEDFENFWSECPWEDDLKYAKTVCNQIQVPLEVVHLTDEYWKNVVSYIIDEYRCGRTPNPDVLCNTRIKFGAFMDAISSMEFDYVASGHYANVVHSCANQIDVASVLELSQDMVKDQTYFLSHLSQAQLKRLIFPLGCISKEEVRKLATKFDLPNKDRKDSQGICFLGKIKFNEFVARHIGEEEGIILEAETGDFLGKHRGFWFYTIGQRQGLRLPGGPWYVVEKDVKNNVVFASRNYFSIDKRRRIFRVGSLKWLSRLAPDQTSHLQCKVRHGPGFYNCSLTMEFGEDVAVVQLSEDDQGLAAGQFAAFYQGNTCLGSGVILESWDDKGFPVCARALEIARMEDKSLLGKPVKIKVKSDSPTSEPDQEGGTKLNIKGQRSSQIVSAKKGRQALFPIRWLQQFSERWFRKF